LSGACSVPAKARCPNGRRAAARPCSSLCRKRLPPARHDPRELRRHSSSTESCRFAGQRQRRITAPSLQRDSAEADGLPARNALRGSGGDSGSPVAASRLLRERPSRRECRDRRCVEVDWTCADRLPALTQRALTRSWTFRLSLRLRQSLYPSSSPETGRGPPGLVFGGPTAARRTAARLPDAMRATIALERSVSANQMSGNSDRRRAGVPVGEGAPGCWRG
jgi:hypothetical protein